jgi:hypothetical protein
MMNRKLFFFAAWGIMNLFVFVACRATPFTPGGGGLPPTLIPTEPSSAGGPTVILPTRDRSAEFSGLGMDVYVAAGCSYTQEWELRLDCPAGSPPALLGCEQILPDKSLAALSPQYALAICRTSQPPPELAARFQKRGCIMPYYYSHVVNKDGVFQLLSTEAEFRALFAPLNSGEAVLSYALAATDLRAQTQKFDSIYKMLSEEIRPTQVLETADGFQVNLFTSTSPACGCGLHTTDMLTLLITRDGEIKRLDAKPAYQFEACID